MMIGIGFVFVDLWCKQELFGKGILCLLEQIVDSHLLTKLYGGACGIYLLHSCLFSGSDGSTIGSATPNPI